MQAVGTWKSGYESVVTDDHAHAVTVDLPIDEGGRSAGPSALGLTLLSLAGGLTTVFAQVAHKRHLAYQALTVALEAERPEGSTTIARVHGTLRIRTRAEPAEVEAALRFAVRACPVAAIFERAGIPVDVASMIVAPAGSA